MRRLLLFVLAMAFMGNCNGFTVLDVRWPPVNRLRLKAHITDTIKTASEVFTKLGNTKTHSFVNKLNKIKEEKLLSALKGVTYAARVLSGSLVIRDKETRSHINTINRNIEKLSEKVYSRLKFMIMKGTNGQPAYAFYSETGMGSEPRMDYEIRKEIATPVNITSYSMIDYLKTNTSVSKSQFLKDCKEMDLKNVRTRLINNTMTWIEDKLHESEFSNSVFDETRSNITRFFFQTYILEYFEFGVQYNGSRIKSNKLQMKSLENGFKMGKRKFYVIMKQAYSDFHATYFPGTIKEDIIRPLVDKVKGNNCGIAESVLSAVETTYPQRQYVVIVSHGIDSPVQYSSFGFPKQMLIAEHNGYTVMVFMATRSASSIKQNSYSREMALEITRLAVNGTDLDKSVAYATSGLKYHQMAAIYNRYGPCVRASNVTIADSFELTFGHDVVQATVIF